MPLLIAFTVGQGIAEGAPQDFVTAPDTAQSGTTDTTPLAQPPEPTAERDFLPGFHASPRVQQSDWRSYEDYRSGNQQSSYDSQALGPAATPSPRPSPPPAPTLRRTAIAPIDIPDGYIGVGGEIVPYDRNVVDPNLVEQFNNTSQALQADGGNFLVDAGFADAPRADRISAGVATGIVAGGTAGLLTSLVPATVITATGAGLGGALGVAASTGSGVIVWGGPVGWVFIPGAAALAGGVAGAALSAPIVLGLTVTGAALGGLLGATVTGGEQQIIEEPAPVLAPAAKAQAPAPAAPVWTPPQDVLQVLDTAPSYVEQARQAVTDVPGGADVLTAVDTVIADNAPALDQGAAALTGALSALNIGA
ncbi:hypothetical protein HQ325_03220 [Rhodococcus sp. BP-349]|nr:hypothetical protein [Rhodococcus sp. BP-363]MBY6542012.1 hypothetical protein [Rhodococcus sp. BP-369]MBY6561242.1 hypothetical protein [Rhodococcus sp. BP-370]MBY6575534.1 hypothetical protein [Rhodococcus sp. BP-364]MBY6584835.1 hypothetical protein [Rhodococcus sp. BP-358]MBY6589172.1 hypothetical protein [Rhodococcus sp. BP-362]MBY6594295.1 hypothetical protein [Rhodococcus sp. BP-359]MBY6597848.1 hypothetical protein [Rhodococcus sp. BP-353]MBY6602972.1 hypothetical protein [Rhodoc